MHLENPAQMPVAHAQPQGQSRNGGPARVRPHLWVVQPAGGLLGEDGAGVFGGPMALQRGEFGAAAQARPKASLLGLRRVLKKTAILAFRARAPGKWGGSKCRWT